jgi:hypothetical protein
MGPDVGNATGLGSLVNRMLEAYTGVQRRQSLYTKGRELLRRKAISLTDVV